MIECLVNENYIIKKYLGVPYKHKGRDSQGLDCWGLLKAVYSDLGHTLIDFDIDYDEDWRFKGGNLFIENYYKQWEEVSKPLLFDGVLIVNSKGIAYHAGVVLSGGRLLHTCNAGVVVGRLNDYSRTIIGYFRIKK